VQFRGGGKKRDKERCFVQLVLPGAGCRGSAARAGRSPDRMMGVGVVGFRCVLGGRGFIWVCYYGGMCDYMWGVIVWVYVSG
jgi:hypothetical protein